MLLVVQTKTSDRLDILQSQRSEQESDVGNLICDIVLSEDLSPNDLSLGCFCYVCYSFWKYSIAIICSAILCKEANESLQVK